MGLAGVFKLFISLFPFVDISLFWTAWCIHQGWEKSSMIISDHFNPWYYLSATKETVTY